MARRHPDLPEFLSRISLISRVYMPLSSPADAECEELIFREITGFPGNNGFSGNGIFRETDFPGNDGYVFTSLTYFWPLAMLVAP